MNIKILHKVIGSVNHITIFKESKSLGVETVTAFTEIDNLK